MKKKLSVIIVLILCLMLIPTNGALAKDKKYKSLNELEADIGKGIKSNCAFVNNVLGADGWIIIADREIKLSDADYMKKIFHEALNSLKSGESRASVEIDGHYLRVALIGPIASEESVYFLEIDDPETALIGDYVFFFTMHDFQERVVPRVYEVRWYVEEVIEKGRGKHRLIWRTGPMPIAFKGYKYTPRIPYRISLVPDGKYAIHTIENTLW